MKEQNASRKKLQVLCSFPCQKAFFCCSKSILISFVMIRLWFRSWWLLNWCSSFHRSLAIRLRVDRVDTFIRRTGSFSLTTILLPGRLEMWTWVTHWFLSSVWCISSHSFGSVCDSWLSLILRLHPPSMFCTISNVSIEVRVKIEQKVLLLRNLYKLSGIWIRYRS